MLFYSFFSDIPKNYEIFFQDPATPIMEGIVGLHNDIFFFLVIIFTFVS